MDSAKMPSHVHIGGGSLGLGFVAPSILAGGRRKLTIVNRGSRSPHHSLLARNPVYKLRVEGRIAQEIAGFEYLVDPPEEKFVQACAGAQCVLVTTAVGEANFPAVAKLIAAGVSGRRSAGVKGRLAILPCENIANVGVRMADELRAHLPSPTGPGDSPLRDVVILDTIPDRICTRVVVDGADVVVDVEPAQYASWSILDPVFAGAEEVKPHVEGLGFASLLSVEDMDIMWHRKLWCFNGFHIAAAARAFQAGHLYLHEVFEGEHGLRLQRLAGELALALHLYSYAKYRRDTREENLKFARLAALRMAAHKSDRTDRILERLLVLESIPGDASIPPGDRLEVAAKNMETFLSKLEVRLGQPAELLFLNARDVARLRGKELQIGLHVLLCISAMREVFGTLSRPNL